MVSSGVGLVTNIAAHGFEQRRCRRCDILIYSSRREAVAADGYWSQRYRLNNITGRPNKLSSGDPVGARFVPHINGAVGDLCAACARETAGHYELVTGRQVGIYNDYFGGEFPGEPADSQAAGQEDVDMRRNELSDDDVIALHRQYVLDGKSATEIGLQIGVSDASIGSWFRQLELPVRLRNGRWRVADVARVCEIHDLTLDQIPGADKAVDKAKKPPRAKVSAFDDTVIRQAVGAPVLKSAAPANQPEVQAAAPAETKTADNAQAMPDPDKESKPRAVIPAQETAVAANGHGSDQANDLRVQLGVIQELLSLAEAKQVTLRGKISVELHAEVAF